MCRMFSLLRDSRGQSITEFALVLPLLLVLVGGIVDFGLIFFIGQVIQNAAREGARVAATTPTPGPVSGSGTFPACQTTGSAIIKGACSRIPNVGLFDGFTVTNSDVVGAAPNKRVTVTVTGQYSWFLLKLIPSPLPLLGNTNFSAGPVTISRSTAMRWEWQ
jgi:Flp pilus assembly protein TadG